jgi:hypothetical protein
MALSAFTDKEHQPEAAEVAAMLGASSRIWDALVRQACERYANIFEEWNHSGAQFGWTLRLKIKTRSVIYMTPQSGEFIVGIVLGEKAVAAALQSGLPPHLVALIDAAPRYAEGRGMRMTIRNDSDLEGILRMVEAKLTSRR